MANKDSHRKSQSVNTMAKEISTGGKINTLFLRKKAEKSPKHQQRYSSHGNVTNLSSSA